MEDFKLNLSSRKLPKTMQGNRLSKWSHFDVVVSADNDEAVGFLKCKACLDWMRYNSKKTGNSALRRNVGRGCRMQAAAGGLQSNITGFTINTTFSKKITLPALKRSVEI